MKKQNIHVLIFILLITAGTVQSVTNAKQTVMDQWYSLIDSDTELRIGARHVVIEKTGNEYVINERASIEEQIGTISYDSQVRYEIKPKIKPIMAKAVTYVNGQAFMSGSIDINPAKLTMKTAMIDEKGKIIKPVVTEIQELDKPGTLLFYQGLEYIGPELLANQNKTENVIFIVFPSEIDMSAEMESNCKLTRENDEENYTITMYPNDNSELSLCRWSLDNKNKVSTGTFFNVRMIATTKEQALMPLDNGFLEKQKDDEN